MRQLSLLLLLSAAMFCSTAMAKFCRYHSDCSTGLGTNQACSQYRGFDRGGICADLCFSHNCNKGVNNARDRWGTRPLHIAAGRNNVDLAKLLLANSAYVDRKDNSGQTALQVAAAGNSVDLAKVLIAHSANVDSADYYGTTALHFAARENSVDVAQLLLANSADVDSTDNEGGTALHEAAYWNSVGVARLLLAKSANLNARVVSGYCKGLTPLQVAEKERNQRMVELLRNA